MSFFTPEAVSWFPAYFVARCQLRRFQDLQQTRYQTFKLSFFTQIPIIQMQVYQSGTNLADYS